MTAEEPSNHGSSNKVLPVKNKYVLQTSGGKPLCSEDPYKLMLDAILVHLAYPMERYDFDIDECAQVSATVTFYNSAHTHGNLTRAIKIVDDAANDSEKPEESAAREGIRYMKISEGLEKEDLHYSEMEYVRHGKMDVEDQLMAVQADKYNLKKELLLAAKNMVFSDLPANDRSFGQGDQSERINMTLELFVEIADNLGSVARQVQKSATDNVISSLEQVTYVKERYASCTLNILGGITAALCSQNDALVY